MSYQISKKMLSCFKDAQLSSTEWDIEGFFKSMEVLDETSIIRECIFLWSETPLKTFLEFILTGLRKRRFTAKDVLKAVFSRKTLKHFLKAKFVNHPGLLHYLTRAFEFDRNLKKTLKRLSPKEIHLFWLELPVTVSCNKRCKYCIPMTGKFGHHVKNDLTEEEVLESLSLASKSIKDVSYLRLIGGEPLLCPFLPEIIKAVPENFAQEIRIVTNATFVPETEGLWEAVKARKVVFEVSDYPFRQPLKDFLENQGIPWVGLTERRWRDFGLPGTLPSDRKADYKQFYNCGLACRQVVKGRLNYCSRISFSSEYNLMPLPESGHLPGSVDLSAPDAARRILEMECFPSKPAVCNQCLNGTPEAKVVPNGKEQWS